MIRNSDRSIIERKFQVIRHLEVDWHHYNRILAPEMYIVHDDDCFTLVSTEQLIIMRFLFKKVKIAMLKIARFIYDQYNSIQFHLLSLKHFFIVTLLILAPYCKDSIK